MLKKFVNKAEEAIKQALECVNNYQGDGSTKDTTLILNAQYYIGQYHAYLTLIEEFNFNKLVEMHDKYNNDWKIISEFIDKIYYIKE